ncbi:MAG: iron ABC transporter permease [Oscillospiraceae bacterium]|jgi:iron complex transport system permease protein|nr:iron ABC transporter permease [Oscillospiraceae bacterium]
MAKKPFLTAMWFIIFAAGVALIFLFNVGMGSADITVPEILRIVFGGADQSETGYLIIQRIRLPRALAGMCGGAALAIAGFLLQTYFSNPIVEPYVLGISSGSSLFVGLVMLGGITFGFQRITPIFLFIGAFIGAAAIMLIILFAAVRVKNIITLLIVGLMAGYVCGAATSILSTFAEREQLANFTMWSMGSFAGFTWLHLKIMYAIVCPMLLLSFLMAKPLNALNMGDKYAQSMGINVKVARYSLIFISSVLTAAVTAFAGPVSFIGLAVPHICRIIFHTSDSRILIPGAILGGAFMASLCDFAARNILSPADLPLGAVTAVIGAPIVVFLLTRKEKL